MDDENFYRSCDAVPRKSADLYLTWWPLLAAMTLFGTAIYNGMRSGLRVEGYLLMALVVIGPSAFSFLLGRRRSLIFLLTWWPFAVTVILNSFLWPPGVWR